MKITVLLLAAALVGPASAAEAGAREFVELAPGRYTIALTGLVCTVCARAIAAQWAELPEVESAAVDFDASTARVAVRLGRTLKVAALRKSLRRAEKLANLDARYDLGTIAYSIGE
ncbi:MAG: heavy-metal-associated domain-containing protein [Elusimicrobia bacterium]|nr:heavy-metal-associated domain-containing protein [Elusimicrobiota bacterium]